MVRAMKRMCFYCKWFNLVHKACGNPAGNYYDIIFNDNGECDNFVKIDS